MDLLMHSPWKNKTKNAWVSVRRAGSIGAAGRAGGVEFVLLLVVEHAGEVYGRWSDLGGTGHIPE